jgi:hypothetical protein
MLPKETIVADAECGVAGSSVASFSRLRKGLSGDYKRSCDLDSLMHLFILIRPESLRPILNTDVRLDSINGCLSDAAPPIAET